LTRRAPPSTLPAVTSAAKQHWDDARRGVLSILRCEACGYRWFPPTANCPTCLSHRLATQPVSGRARLWSWTVICRQYFKDFPPPYVVALVELEEGQMITTTIVQAHPETLRCDQPLVVVFETFADGTALPQFRPAQ